MKKIIASLFVFMIVCSTVIAVPTDAEIQAAASELGVDFDSLKALVGSSTTETTEPSDYVSTTVEEYMNTYNDNEYAADQKFTGKTVRMEITVSSIDTTWFTDEYVIKAETDNLFALDFYIQESEYPKLANIKRGSHVLMEGRGSSMFSVYDAKIIKVYN